MNKSNSPNIDIHVKEISYTKQNKFISSQLVLEFSGKDSNSVIANTFRRVSYDDIPTYAFEYVDIQHNNSKAFDNDFMRDHLRQLPIYDIKNNMHYLDPIYWQNVDYYNKNREKHPEDKLSMEITINKYNNTNELMSVTTKDMEYRVDDKLIEYPNRNPDEPILLIELLPNQTFKCHMKGCLGVGERDSIWFASKVCFYKLYDDNPNKIQFTIEATGQMSEYEILVKCCRLIKLKLKSIATEIEQRVASKEIKIAQTIFIELINEDHTIGSLINNALQDHPHIAFSGVSKPDHLVKQIKFKIICTDDVESPIQPLYDVTEYLINVFSNLEKQFINIGNVNLTDTTSFEKPLKTTKKGNKSSV